MSILDTNFLDNIEDKFKFSNFLSSTPPIEDAWDSASCESSSGRWVMMSKKSLLETICYDLKLTNSKKFWEAFLSQYGTPSWCGWKKGKVDVVDVADNIHEVLLNIIPRKRADQTAYFQALDKIPLYILDREENNHLQIYSEAKIAYYIPICTKTQVRIIAVRGAFNRISIGVAEYHAVDDSTAHNPIAVIHNPITYYHVTIKL